jgi:hypothetical protein
MLCKLLKTGWVLEMSHSFYDVNSSGWRIRLKRIYPSQTLGGKEFNIIKQGNQLKLKIQNVQL